MCGPYISMSYQKFQILYKRRNVKRPPKASALKIFMYGGERTWGRTILVHFLVLSADNNKTENTSELIWCRLWECKDLWRTLSNIVQRRKWSVAGYSLMAVGWVVSYQCCSIKMRLPGSWQFVCSNLSRIKRWAFGASVAKTGARFTNFYELFLTRILNAILNRLIVDS
jgi:hypothetical protein